jgi:hypothetical protein
MKGTIVDFLRLASEKPELAREFLELAARHDFEFSDELRDEELESVAGGAGLQPGAAPTAGLTASRPAGDLGDCYLLAALAAVAAHDPSVLRNDDSDGSSQYVVEFEG